MDLNDLYMRHQVSLFRAANAACEPSQRAHSEMAGRYAEQIQARKAEQLTAAVAA